MDSRLISPVIAIVLIAAAMPAIGGCAVSTGMKKSEKADVSSGYKGKRMFLRTSMYYGSFYGDRYSYLIAARRFEELRQLEDQNGKPIIPGSATGIIPAGREVRIEKVEFPPAERPLLTPRFYPWVYMKIDKTFTDKPHVLVLQPDPGTPKEFDRILGSFLQTEDPRPGIDSRPFAIRNAIDSKELVEGMTQADVIGSLGYPDSVYKDASGGENWNYPLKCITFTKGVVASFAEKECGG